MKNNIVKILVIKLSAIGDVVHSLPFLEVLRNKYPSAKIDWVIEEGASAVLEGHHDLDRLLCFRRKSWLRKLKEIRKYGEVTKDAVIFCRELRKRDYDIIIDLQGLFKSGILTFLAKGTRKIGFSNGREGSNFFVNERVPVPDPNIHALDRYLGVAQYLGGNRTGWKGRIPLHESDKAYADELLKKIGSRRSLIAINPMAKWETKLWELRRFSALADLLNRELDAEILFTGGEADKTAIQTILSNMRTRALNLAGKTSLKQLAYLYQRCVLVISTDTGPMHIAAAMGTPVVALFGPTSPLRTGPYGLKHRVISAEIECSPCFRKKCDDRSCMEEITVEQVFEAVKQALNP